MSKKVLALILLAAVIGGLIIDARVAYAADDCSCGCGESCTDACSYDHCNYQCGSHDPGDYWCSGDYIKHCYSSGCGQKPCELQQTCSGYDDETGECIAWEPSCCDTNSETGECLKYNHTCGDYPSTEELLTTTKNCNDYDCSTGLYWKCESRNIVKKYGDDYTCGSADGAVFTAGDVGCIVSGDRYCWATYDCDSKDGTTTTVFEVWTCRDDSVKELWGDDYYCDAGSTASASDSWYVLCKIYNNSSALVGRDCDCSDYDGLYVETQESTKKLDSYCSGYRGEPTDPSTDDATCEQNVVYRFDCSTLNNWYGIDEKIGESETPGCTDITFYGDKAYKAEGEAVQGDPEYDCEDDFVGYRTECSNEYSPKWSDLKIAGCTLVRYTRTYDLNVGYLMYDESGNKVTGNGYDVFTYKYIVEYLGAKTVGNQERPEAVQEVKYRKDQCIFQSAYTRDTGNADNEEIDYGWFLDEASAKIPDKYHLDVQEYNAPPDYIREWKCDIDRYGDYEDCKAVLPRGGSTPFPKLAPSKNSEKISLAIIGEIGGVTPINPIHPIKPTPPPETPTSTNNNCEALYENGPEGWYKTADTGEYVWVDKGCYYGRCAAAFYDPDMPTTAFVIDGTPTASFAPRENDYEYTPVAYGSDPKYVILYNRLGSDVPNHGAMCEKSAEYGENIGPAAGWGPGEWYEFKIYDADLRAAIRSEGIEGWWITTTRWGHCCGDDDGEKISTDCNSATEDFDPITCQCVPKGTSSPLGTYTMTYRPNCAVIDLNVIPTLMTEGQQANIVALVGNLGDTTATSATVTMNYGDGTAETIPISVLEAGETRRIVVQHVYRDAGTYTVKVTITCPSDNKADDDEKDVTGVKVEKVVTTAPAGTGEEKSAWGDYVAFITAAITRIGKILLAGGN